MFISEYMYSVVAKLKFKLHFSYIKTKDKEITNKIFSFQCLFLNFNLKKKKNIFINKYENR